MKLYSGGQFLGGGNRIITRKSRGQTDLNMKLKNVWLNASEIKTHNNVSKCEIGCYLTIRSSFNLLVIFSNCKK